MGWGDVWHRGGQPGGRGPQVRPRRIPRGCGESKGKEREGVRMDGCVCVQSADEGATSPDGTPGEAAVNEKLQCGRLEESGS